MTDIRKVQSTTSFVRPLLNPLNGLRLVWRHRLLIAQLTKREVAARYKGSVLGLLWSLVTPIVMLAVYTFVFSVVFKMRWQVGAEQSNLQFALVLFAGLIPFNLFAEVLNSSSGIVSSNPNLVKRVVFPLETLPVVRLCAVLVHNLVGLVVLLIAVALDGSLSWTVVLLPVVMAPLLLFALGLSYYLAAIGVFVRDVAPTVALVMALLVFMTPVFYPLAGVPEAYRDWLFLNPLTPIVESVRDVVLWQRAPNWTWLAGHAVAAAFVCWTGLLFFAKGKRAYADVL